MLKQIIADRIKKEGPISFRDFMEMALYYPGYGYYASADTEIGGCGDFYTSSHVHPVFGALIGKQIAEMWEVMEKPNSFHIIEMGAGRGYLAHDPMGKAFRQRTMGGGHSFRRTLRPSRSRRRHPQPSLRPRTQLERPARVALNAER